MIATRLPLEDNPGPVWWRPDGMRLRPSRKETHRIVGNEPGRRRKKPGHPKRLGAQMWDGTGSHLRA